MSSEINLPQLFEVNTRKRGNTIRRLLLQKTLIIVTARKTKIEWAEIDDIYNWDWELYVVIWDEGQKILFINSSCNEGEYKGLAAAVAGDEVQLINEQAVFRSVAGIERLRLQKCGTNRATR